MVGFVAGSFRRCPDDPCSSRAIEFVFPLGGGAQDRHISLEKGNYQIFALTESPPLTIQLHFQNLDGYLRFEAQDRVRAGTGTAPVQVAVGPEGNIHSDGQTYRFRDKGFLLGIHWLGTSPSSVSVSGSCLWNRKPPYPTELAYGPTCRYLGAEEGSMQPEVWIPPGGSADTFSVVYESDLGAGQWGFGTYSLTPDRIRNAGSVFAWFDAEMR